MDFDYSGTIDFATLINAPLDQNVFTEFDINVQEPEMDRYFDTVNPQWYPAEDISALVYPPLPLLPFDINLPLYSPPTTPERLATPPFTHLPSSGLCFEELSATQPPANTQQTPPPTPPVPVWQPTSHQIKNFSYCPHTKNGKICGFVSWSSSGTKTIERHLKRKHLDPGSNAKVFRCPNPHCKRNGLPFWRKDSLKCHRRKTCDSWHAQRIPDYVPLSHIEQGSDKELRRWMRAGFGQRNSIREKLKAGTPWSLDLLQPIHL